MAIIKNENATMETLYSAYGYTVNGKLGIYEWLTLNRDAEKCIVEIEILKDGTSVYSEYMGNRLILKSTFDNHIDNVLWHINNENITDIYRIESITDKVLVNNDCLFSYMIENKKRKEREDKERKAREEKILVEQKELETSIKEESEKRGLYVYNDYGTIHILRLIVDCREVLEKCNDNVAMGYIDYAKKNRLKEIEYIKEVDSLESALEYIRTLKTI